MKAVMTVDLAHPPMSGSDAEATLDASLLRVRSKESLQVLKVIHGYGNDERDRALKGVVQNWIRRNEKRIISSIDGRDLSAANPKLQVLLSEISAPETHRFDTPDDRVTIVWVT